MSLRNSLLRVTAGALAVAVMSFPALARDDKDTTTDLSAQAIPGPKPNKKAAPRNVAPAQRIGPRPAPVQRVAPPRQAPVRVAPAQVAPTRVAPTRVAPTRVAPVRTAPVGPRVIQRQAVPRVNGGQRNIVAPRNSGPRIVAPVTDAPMTAAPRIITRGPPGQANRAFTPRGGNRSNVVSAARIRGVPARGVGRTSIQGRNYSVWRSNYRVRRGGGWRTFVALGALGTLAIGAADYYPYAYIQAPEPYCDGRTEDGCQLVWEDVETSEGGAYAQCVAYCPWQ